MSIGINLLAMARSGGATLGYSIVTVESGLSSLLTFTRASSANYTNQSGIITTAATNVPRTQHYG